MNSSPGLSEDAKAMWGCGGVLIALALALFGASSLVRSCNEAAEIKGAGQILQSSHSEKSGSSPQKGFSLEQLRLTSMPMSGKWIEEDILVNDVEEWIGSTCVVSVSKDAKYLYLVTNRHCLGLNSLWEADGSGDEPEVVGYELNVHFPGGKDRKVIDLAWLEGAVDLAWIRVEHAGLVEGRDFVSLGGDPEVKTVEGDEVVAVGSPLDLGFEGTHTFGRISAFRNELDTDSSNVRYIQVDAALNPGNSGGPLFLKSNGSRYSWIGINTMGAGQGIGLAIDVGQINRKKILYPEATSAGIEELFRSLRSR